MLQRGRALASAEICHAERHQRWVLPASTGPRSRERGNDFVATGTGVVVTVLQRGRALASAEICWRCAPAFRGTGLQRGRALASAEITSAVRVPGPPGALQRGRALASAEIPARAVDHHAAELASTGPRSRERGNLCARPGDAGGGAASTGPRSRERGNPVVEGLGGGGNTLLQRGRALASAEICSTLHFMTVLARLQRGRALASAEMSCVPVMLARSIGLQRGRALASAEIPPFGRGRGGNVCASTGPRSRERGNQSSGSPEARRSTRFNGAALSRARKSSSMLISKSRSATLQRGRALASAEMVLGYTGTGKTRSSFNGAALSRARK